MHLQQTIKTVINQIGETIDKLSGEEYTFSRPVLLHASIGQHVRHIIDLFLQLEAGYETGVVNYDLRRRDQRIETDPHFAQPILRQILDSIDKPDKPLLLETYYQEGISAKEVIETNYRRELAYNLEHAIHHMALIRIGLKDISKLEVPENFGISPATLKYRNSCAQ
jgi:hypothetical protein